MTDFTKILEKAKELENKMKASQEPLNPVWPVSSTFLPEKDSSNICIVSMC